MWHHSLLPRRWFGRLTLLAIVVTTAIGVILLKTVDVQGLDALQADVRTAAPVLAIVRLTFIAGLIIAFFTEYYAGHRPVVIPGYARQWPAMAWTPESLAERFGPPVSDEAEQ